MRTPPGPRTPPPHPWLVVEVLTDAGGGAYTWREVWDTGAGTLAEKVGGRYGGAANPGVDVLSAGFAAGDYALCRPAEGRAGTTFELYPFGGGSAAAGLATCAGVAGAGTTDCLALTVTGATGACSGIDLTQELYLAWDAGDARWEVPGFVHDGGTGEAHFGLTNGAPYLTIAGVYGTPLGCDGAGGLLFAFGGGALCTGTAGTCNNSFVVRVACSCCPIAGWGGPGWYCVEDTGPDDCVAVELLDADKCDTAIVICSGPYADQAAAEAVCVPPVEPGYTCGTAWALPATGVTYNLTGSYTTGANQWIKVGALSAGDQVKVTTTRLCGAYGTEGDYSLWTGGCGGNYEGWFATVGCPGFGDETRCRTASAIVTGGDVYVVVHLANGGANLVDHDYTIRVDVNAGAC